MSMFLSTAQPTYDDDGNMLTDGTGKTYTWDCENRLIQVELPNNEIVKYDYDAGSHRIKRDHLASTSTTTTTYLYDDWNVIEEKTTIATIGDPVPEVSTTSAPTTTIYHWGLDLSNALQSAGGVGGLLQSKTTTTETPTQHHYLYDANGNVSELLGTNGVNLAHYQYDPFGNAIISTGPSVFENFYRFSTKQLDPVAHIHYYGYRFYDSPNGRWINRDLIEESFEPSLYALSGNDSVGKIDILGLAAKPPKPKPPKPPKKTKSCCGEITYDPKESCCITQKTDKGTKKALKSKKECYVTIFVGHTNDMREKLCKKLPGRQGVICCYQEDVIKSIEGSGNIIFPNPGIIGRPGVAPKPGRLNCFVYRDDIKRISPSANELFEAEYENGKKAAQEMCGNSNDCCSSVRMQLHGINKDGRAWVEWKTGSTQSDVFIGSYDCNEKPPKWKAPHFKH